MKTLSIDEILKAKDIDIESVDCPRWGGQVFVRSISADDRDHFEETFLRESDGKRTLVGMRRNLVGLCLCDEAGKFIRPTEAQLIALGKKSAAMMDRVYGVCQRINGMLVEQLEETEKNSEPEGQNGSGSS